MICLTQIANNLFAMKKLKFYKHLHPGDMCPPCPPLRTPMVPIWTEDTPFLPPEYSDGLLAAVA